MTRPRSALEALAWVVPAAVLATAPLMTQRYVVVAALASAVWWQVAWRRDLADRLRVAAFSVVPLSVLLLALPGQWSADPLLGLALVEQVLGLVVTEQVLRLRTARQARQQGRQQGRHGAGRRVADRRVEGVGSGP